MYVLSAPKVQKRFENSELSGEKIKDFSFMQHHFLYGATVEPRLDTVTLLPLQGVRGHALPKTQGVALG